MSLTTAIANLATKGGTVSGITTSFDQDDIPDSLSNASLPALLHLPGGGTNTREAFDNNFWTFVHTVRVILLYKAAASGRLEDNLAGIVTLIDSYITAIRADDTLSGAVVDAVVTAYAEPGVLEFADIPYHGVEFTVTVTEYVQP